MTKDNFHECPKALDAPSLLAEAQKHPTLDDFMQRDPTTLTPKDRKAIVAILRQERTRFTTAEENRKAKGQAALDPESESESESENED